ncbi:selenium-binding protein [Pseudonocardia sp. EC080625-04]|uniref:selenium-binding protein SBP56-related protein n=1 Tax=Pseudonocardia sp. EC080625-04 TaxID=1096868 RepID=UPI0006CB4F4B|nr:selenium-binding protein SBP56-related protein [Pseudonocardia sp. EC080625-04]ALE72485.1 selenium-binding protein [Pseudonocardia sp. EC080625-04]
MSTPTTDPTFYRSAAEAAAAPPEQLAYVAAFDRSGQRDDAMVVVDVAPGSSSYGRVVGWTPVPGGGELHHFGWNACSSALAHEGHGTDGLARRYLLVPGLRSSDVHVLDTEPDPRAPRLVRTVGAKELSERAGYSRPHTLHCGPDGVFMTCLGGAEGDDDGPGGIALLDHDTFEVLRAWETDRGPQHFHYDAWWHLNRNVLISSEWGSPSMIEDGLQPELLLSNAYGHAIHFWDLAEGRHLQRVDLGARQQMALEVRPSHDPEATWGFVGVVISTEDLSGSVWRWYLDEAAGEWKAEKVITIPAEPAATEQLPPALQPFGAVPPIVTDIDLSVDDRFLYVSCWGTGELKQFDVSDPARPRETGSVRLGGIVERTPHPARPELPLAGGPQMVEVSRDGRRVYFTNSLYGALDDQFYPDGVGAWMAKLDAGPAGGLSVDTAFFPHGDEFRGLRVHQVRLQGGDASSDSYCHRS